MIELDGVIVEALLKFKRNDYPFLGVVLRSYNIHSIVTGGDTASTGEAATKEEMSND